MFDWIKDKIDDGIYYAKENPVKTALGVVGVVATGGAGAAYFAGTASASSLVAGLAARTAGLTAIELATAGAASLTTAATISTSTATGLCCTAAATAGTIALLKRNSYGDNFSAQVERVEKLPDGKAKAVTAESAALLNDLSEEYTDITAAEKLDNIRKLAELMFQDAAYGDREEVEFMAKALLSIDNTDDFVKEHTANMEYQDDTWVRRVYRHARGGLMLSFVNKDETRQNNVSVFDNSDESFASLVGDTLYNAVSDKLED